MRYQRNASIINTGQKMRDWHETKEEEPLKMDDLEEWAYKNNIQKKASIFLVHMMAGSRRENRASGDCSHSQQSDLI